jgi:pimeloyl-ACP methyl ester carboxylesterase
MRGSPRGSLCLHGAHFEPRGGIVRRGEVHVFPHSGHWPFADDPAAVEGLLLDFPARVA